MGNNQYADIVGRGDMPAVINVAMLDNGQESTKSFFTSIPVKHTPGMARNLFSVKRAWDRLGRARVCERNFNACTMRACGEAYPPSQRQ